MNLPKSKLRVSTWDPAVSGTAADESTEAELSDLRQALKLAKTPAGRAEEICNAHRLERQRLAACIEAKTWWADENSDSSTDLQGPERHKPRFELVRCVEELPREFAEYFEAYVTWQNPGVKDKDQARRLWKAILERSAPERKYKSTWAAFMLGRSYEIEEPELATQYFRKVRELALAGFPDSLGLGVSSLGWEARIYLKKGQYESAFDLYTQQVAVGVSSSTNSLLFTAGQALQAPDEVLVRLARHEASLKVLTAYAASLGAPYSGDHEPASGEGIDAEQANSSEPPREGPAERWLRAAEAAGVKDPAVAEVMALTAYQAKDLKATATWAKRSPRSPVSQWLQAKLMVSSGKIDGAAGLLGRLCPAFPIVPEGTNAPTPVELKDTLIAQHSAGLSYGVKAGRLIRGELAALQLSRGRFAEALDLFLTAGFWVDAAYVAERVLTVDELKAYVDGNWPAADQFQIAEEQRVYEDSAVSPARLREQIRYLLGRRLTRSIRGDEARSYYPEQGLEAYDSLAANLVTGWAETGVPNERAAALLAAARVTRSWGMELVGTEVGPDWHIYQGNSESWLSADFRKTNSMAVLLKPSTKELERYAQHEADPPRRFHYRYQAASLAWEAAKLLPDNNEQTALALCVGGSFVKTRDPEFADLFYKALVRRNRFTEIGAEASKVHWFPQLDAEGRVVIPERTLRMPETEQVETGVEIQAPETNGTVAAEPETQDQMETPVEPAFQGDEDGEGSQTGYVYFIYAGDTLSSIAAAATGAGNPVTVSQILTANPDIAQNRLRIGQRIIIPLVKSRHTSRE